MKVILYFLILCNSLFSQSKNIQYYKNNFFKKHQKQIYLADTLVKSSAIPPTVINHGSRSEPKIALTFDACATKKKSGYDKKIIDILVETQTPATLFLGGKWMIEHYEEIKLLSSYKQFELANHSFLHPHLKELPDEQIKKEIIETEKTLHLITKKQSQYFRPPYAEYDDRILNIVAECGLKIVHYDVASGDPDTAITKEKLANYVTEKAKNGSIIVMHMNGRGWHTAEALPEIIAYLKKKKFTFVTISELLHNHQ